MTIIDLNNVVKYYGRQLVLDHLTFSFQTGKVYLLTGENGTGKTTLIKAILQLIHLDEGFILVKTKQIGYVPEKINVPEFVRIFPFLEKLALIKKVDSGSVVDVVEFYLEKWGLLMQKNNFVKTLSKGMLQKLLLIQAFFSNPHLLIFDEPLNGLDETAQKLFFREIKKEKSYLKTIIISTHNLHYYQEIVDHFLTIHHGKLDEKHN